MFRQAVIIVFVFCSHTLMSQQLHYPQTSRGSDKDTFFGIEVSDPYRWLENDVSPDVEAWANRQQEFTEQYLSSIPFRTQLEQRLHEVTEFESVSTPWRVRNKLFYYKNDGKQNHDILYVQEDGIERVLLNPNSFSADGTAGLAFASSNEEGTLLAYGITQAGSDWRTIYVMDIATGKKFTDKIVGVKNSGVSWHKQGFFYNGYGITSESDLSLTARNEGQRVYYHKVGSEQAADQVAFTPEHPSTSAYMYVLRYSPYLIRWESDEGLKGNRIFVKDIGNDGSWDSPGDFVLVYKNDDHGFWPAFFHNGSLYGTTTLDAPNERVVRLTNIKTRPQLETVVPESTEPISAMSWGGSRIFVTRMKDVREHVSIYNTNGNELGVVRLPGLGNVGGFGGEPDDSTLYYVYSSFVTPPTIYAYNVRTNTSEVYYQTKPPFNPDNFQEERIWYTSADGTRIPMFIVSKKGLTLNGQAPTMLYGYGGFGISQGPRFISSYVPWLEQGGIIAIANLRGGGEFGEKWHDAGRKLKKQNVFDDCIAAAEWLISNNYTSKDKLALNGRSNGGLLVGAVMIQRPDLFKVAVPEVGVLDMLRYHLFTIGRYWITDYGSVADSTEFRALYAYSPVHNLKSGIEYPSTMVMTSDHDDRVVPAHSFKFAAELQHTYAGERPMLLRVERRSGHGAINRQKSISNLADKYAFMWWEMNFHPQFPVPAR